MPANVLTHMLNEAHGPRIFHAAHSLKPRRQRVERSAHKVLAGIQRHRDVVAEVDTKSMPITRAA